VLNRPTIFLIAATGLLAVANDEQAQAAASTPAVVATAPASNPISKVLWVCGPFMCVWRPGLLGHPPRFALAWGPPRVPGCIWKRVDHRPWIEVCP
jgi:hypothetical protein